MRFSILERLMLFDILPAQGDFVTLRTIRRLREDLSISEEEQAAIGFSQPEPGEFKWEREGEAKEIEISAMARKVIEKRLRELNDAEKLTMQHYSLYERFLGEGEDGEC